MLGQRSGKKEVKKWLKNGKKVVSFSRNLVVKSLADTETKIQTDTTETSRPIENPIVNVRSKDRHRKLNARTAVEI